MKRILPFLAIAIVAFLVFSGCEQQSTEPEPETFDPPTDVAYVTYQDSVKITWTASDDEGDSGFAGYLIYRRENAGFSSLSDSAIATYLMFPSPVTGTELMVHGLPSDRMHFFALRSIKITGDDTTLSGLSNSVDTSPTIWFSDTIHEVAGGSGVICAIDFDNQLIYPMELTYLNHIDIYLGVNDSARLSLRSPSLYGAEWSGRVAQIKRLGGMADDVSQYDSAGGEDGWASEVEVYPRDIYAVKMGSHYSKVYIQSFYGSDGIVFTAAYQDVEDYDHF